MTPDQGTVVLLRSLAIDPCIVRKLRLRSRLLRWARCKAILKSHAHPEMPFCRFRMARMARPALNHQRTRIYTPNYSGGTAGIRPNHVFSIVVGIRDTTYLALYLWLRAEHERSRPGTTAP